jgi:hypothetical protein
VCTHIHNRKLRLWERHRNWHTSPHCCYTNSAFTKRKNRASVLKRSENRAHHANARNGDFACESANPASASPRHHGDDASQSSIAISAQAASSQSYPRRWHQMCSGRLLAVRSYECSTLPHSDLQPHIVANFITSCIIN